MDEHARFDQSEAAASSGQGRPRGHAAIPTGLSLAIGVITYLANHLQAVGTNLVLRLSGGLLVAAGLTYAGRTLVHVKDHYWNFRPDDDELWSDLQRIALSGLVVVDLSIAAGLVSAGGVFQIDPSRAAQFYAGLSAVLLIAVSSHLTLRLVSAAGLPRGTDTIEHCPVVRSLRNNVELWKSAPGIRQLDAFIWRKTPIGYISGLVVFLILALSVSAVVDKLAHTAHLRLANDRRGLGISGIVSQHPRKLRPHKPRPSDHGPGTSSPGPTGDEAAAIPTYAQDCGTAVIPGQGAPTPEDTELRDAWYEIGGVNAACGGPAHRVPGTADVYYVNGYCGEQLRSVGVAAPDHPAVLLLEGWATFAEKMAQAGKLLGASAHRFVGSGDFQVVYTTVGPYVLIREQVSDGHGGLTGIAGTCYDLQVAKEQPVTVPPGLVGLWLRYERLYQPVWPRQLVAGTTDGITKFVFVMAGSLHSRVAQATCFGAANCTFVFGHTVWRTSTLPPDDAIPTEVVDFGPPAPTPPAQSSP